MNDKLENNKLDDNNLEKVSGGADPGDAAYPNILLGTIVSIKSLTEYIVELDDGDYGEAYYDGGINVLDVGTRVKMCSRGVFYYIIELLNIY